MLGVEMEVRVEEGGEGVRSISVLLGRKSSDVKVFVKQSSNEIPIANAIDDVNLIVNENVGDFPRAESHSPVLT
ncbi:hypothetical protein T12_15093 [Trichinella patagoniensis]|uniref:Uncharacterized protein n=1 Tax=Trichinella patagoniensis TaxID=990121 RepID=A0A0V0Z5U4_9BILA|nr:hypothetical protein T12_15093 [Trichinella patagoniensis]